jgi:hypothetical protein
LESLGKHQFAEDRGVDIVPEAALLGDRKPNGKRVQKPFDLPRITFRSLDENRTDLLRENECGCEFVASRFVDITDLLERDAGAKPWLIQSLASHGQEVFESDMVLAHDRLDEQ